MSVPQVVPDGVPAPSVRRLDGPAAEALPVQQVQPAVLPAPQVVPAQLDPAGMRVKKAEREVRGTLARSREV